MLYVDSIAITLGRGRLPFPLWTVPYCPKAGLWPVRHSWSPHVMLRKECPQRSGPWQRLGKMGRKGKASQAQGERERENLALLSSSPVPGASTTSHLINSHLSPPPGWPPPPEASLVPSPSAESCSQKGANEVCGN